jgi:hypothetical protein
MRNANSKYDIGYAVAAALAVVFQVYGCIRYIRRMPDDTPGILLYIVTAVLFSVLAMVYYFRWIRFGKGS